MALGLVACSSGTDADAVSSGPEAAAPGTSVASVAPGAREAADGRTVAPGGAGTSAPTSAPKEAVTFAFGGDVHFEGALRRKLDADPETVLGAVAPVLAGADLAVVNLETAVTERGTPAPKRFTFRAPATAFRALAAAGVDVASMANNHGIDFGPVGLEDSLAAAAAAGFPVVGVGRNAAEAYAPYRATLKGQRVAVIGATQVLDANLIGPWTATDAKAGLASAKEVDRLVAAVAAARRDADTVVVFLHWGIEGQTCPSAVQQGLARALVDAGADVVVGGHAHRLQGAGRLDGALVAYGLGNFVFLANSEAGARSGVLLVTVRGRDVESYSWEPAVIADGVPSPLPPPAAAQARASWEGLRACTGLAP